MPPFLPSVADQMMTIPMMMRLYAMRARARTQEQTLCLYLCEMPVLDHFKWTWNIMTFAFLQMQWLDMNGFNFGRSHPHGETRGHLPLSLSLHFSLLDLSRHHYRFILSEFALGNIAKKSSNTSPTSQTRSGMSSAPINRLKEISSDR